MPSLEFKKIYRVSALGDEIPAGAVMHSPKAFLCGVIVADSVPADLDMDTRFVYHSSALLTVTVFIPQLFGVQQIHLPFLVTLNLDECTKPSMIRGQ